MRAMWGAIWQAVQHAFARRPAVPLAVMLIVGIAMGTVLPARPLTWLAGIAGLVIAATVLRRRSVPASLLLLAAIFLAGTALVQLESHCFPATDIATFTTEEPRLAQAELKITSAPRVLTQTPQARALPPKQTARAQVLRVKTIHGWQDASGNLALTIDQPHPRLACGQIVRAIGSLQRPSRAMNPGQFDWAAYYRGQRILATLGVPHADALTIIADDGPPWHEAMRIEAHRLLATGFSADRSLQHALLRALVLGDRDADVRQAAEDFSHSGAAHLLAVSGLHVMLVAGFVLIACRLLRLHPRTATYAMLAAVAAYALIVVPGAPALRATVLCAAYAASQLTRRTRDGINILALCAVGLLIYWPHDLLSAGFQLSFGTVFGMLALGPRVMERVVAWYDGDEHARVARSFRPPKFWGSLWLRVRAHVAAMIAIGLLAWLISMPLVMYHFDQVNPWALLAGIVLLPFVALGLAAGLLKILLTLLLPSLAPMWAAMSGKTMALLMWLVDGFAHIPGADVAVPVPPAWFFVAFYLLVLLPLLPWAFSRGRWCIRCGPVAALALLPIFARTPADETRITLLAIGAGQIAVVELPDGRTLLIDDGSSSLADPLRTVLAPYLRTRGRGRVDAIFLSHPDYDHISAAADTAEELGSGVVYMSPVFRQQSRDNEPAEEMLHRLDEDGVPIELLSRGRRIELAPDTAIDVLWPPLGRSFRSTNNAGVVLRLTCPGGRSILFPADIQNNTERELTDTRPPPTLSAEILVAPHHGSAETTTAAFVRAVAPRLILSSNGRRLSRKQHEFDRSMAAAGEPVYRTSGCGAITIAISKTGQMRVETFLANGNGHAIERERN
jgi:competence protein ComEC